MQEMVFQAFSEFIYCSYLLPICHQTVLFITHVLDQSVLSNNRHAN